MALSNIFNEPRREITETLIGMMLVGVPLAVDCYFADSLVPAEVTLRWLAVIFIMFAIAVGTAFGILLAISLVHAAHSLGELICDILDDAGLRLRPQRR